MNVKETIKECRRLARESGAILKTHKRLRINNMPAYYIYNRKTGDVILENCTLNSAYENLLSGFVEYQL